jgi:MATE family multidrug resistance protein
MRELLQENRKTLLLAAPIVAGQLSQMLLGVADTVMIGQVGTVELGAAAFVNTIFHVAFVLSIGLFVALSVQVAQAYGASRLRDAGESLRHGLFGAVLLGVVLAGGLLMCLPFLDRFGQPEAVVALSPSYLVWLALSLIPMVPMLVLRSYSEAFYNPWPLLWLMLGTVLLNIALNYMLIFGHWGAPEMGLTGAGLATFLARMIGVVVVACYVLRSKRLSVGLPERWWAPLRMANFRSLLRIGMPVSVQIVIEFSAFAACALLMGQFGSAALAAHQIALTCATATFMVPLGLSMALTIRVGHALGAEEKPTCVRIILGAALMAVGVMAVSASSFFFFGETIADLFTNDLEVIALAATFLALAGVFQIFDGVQITAMGALRAMHDVLVPTGINVVSCFVLSIPIGIVLAFYLEVGAVGLWIGLAAGLCISACVLSGRLWHQLTKL